VFGFAGAGADGRVSNPRCRDRSAALREPGDILDRSVHLVVMRSDGGAVVSRWMAWHDLVSPWIGGQRPLPTRSQRRVIDRLNLVLDAAGTVNSSTTRRAVERHGGRDR
jgi:hypothetical protein